MTASGTAEEVPAHRLEAARAVYLAKQPHISGFATSPNTAIIEVTVGRYDADILPSRQPSSAISSW